MADNNEGAVSVVHGEQCPVCSEKKLTLSEVEQDVPFFGRAFIFSMRCSCCGYRKSDVECGEQRPKISVAFVVSSKDDLSVRIVKSSQATVKFERLGSIESGEGSDGYVTNVEGLIERFKKVVENTRDTEDDEELKKKAKNIVKKLQKVLWGFEPLKITIDDPSGNSAIISDKTVKK
ncbi:ZPR1 zinc finger domain-containing protein [Candidatus Woesearchaeota archaeon]|nr:ZPR1 zinc finger domain-containing protein [Candidatus Woesearchaeota archaeon]